MKPETDATPPADPPDLWAGLDEYMDSPAFREAMADEFPEDAAEWTDPVSRRRFLTIMGASLALAGAAGCSPRPAPMRKIVPYTRQPEQLTPGVPLLFASAFPLGGFATGVVVISREGRPVKVEGNPDHPSSLGGCDVFAQGSLLDLYDPDRSKVVTHRGSPTTYDEAVPAARWNRLSVAESMLTTTGGKADHRLAVKSGDVEPFARALAAELGVGGVPAAGSLSDAARAWVRPLAADLRKPEHKGKAVVVAGDHQSPAVHALAHAINSALGAVGETVILTAPADARPDGKVIDLPTLVKEMAGKQVEALLILGGNPAFTAPADLDFAGALKNVPFKAHLGAEVDETAILCEWH